MKTKTILALLCPLLWQPLALRAQSLANAMDAPDTTWTAAGSPGWSTVTGAAAWDGVDALECVVASGQGAAAGPEVGATGTVGALLQTTVTGPAVAAFRWRSADWTGQLIFSVDGVLMAQHYAQQHEQGWARALVNLPAGPHTLTWRVFRPAEYALPEPSRVALDAFTLSPAGSWPLPAAMEDADGVWVAMTADQTEVSAAAAGPQSGTGVSLLADGGVWYGAVSRLVEGPVTASWDWQVVSGPDVDEAYAHFTGRHPYGAQREPVWGAWESARMAVPAGTRRAVQFVVVIDDRRNETPTPAMQLDRFQLSPLSLSSQINVAGLTWTGSGPWEVTPELLHYGVHSPGSLEITGASPGQSFSLITQVAGPALLAWLDRPYSALDGFTATLDGQPALTPILVPGVESLHGVEIPAGVHEVTISLNICAAPTPAGQTRGGIIGAFSLLPVAGGALRTALGLPAAASLYADAGWTPTAAGAQLTTQWGSWQPLYISVAGPALVRTPLTWSPKESWEQPGPVNRWIEVQDGRHLVDLSEIATRTPLTALLTAPEILTALTTGQAAVAAALDVPEAALLPGAGGRAFQSATVGAVGGDAILLPYGQQLQIAVLGQENLTLRYQGQIVLTVDGESIVQPAAAPDGDGWQTWMVPLSAGPHLVIFTGGLTNGGLLQGYHPLMDNLQFTPAPTLPVAEAMDAPGTPWRVTGAAAGFAGDGVCGDYVIVAGGDKVETDVTGPVMVTVRCRGGDLQVNAGTDIVLQPAWISGPYTGWFPVQITLPAGATTLTFTSLRGMLLDDFQTAPAPPFAAALDWSGPLYTAAAGAGVAVQADTTATGGSALRLDVMDYGRNAQLSLPVTGPALVRWRQRFLPGGFAPTVYLNGYNIPQPTLEWSTVSVVVPQGAPALDLRVLRGTQGAGNLMVDQFESLPLGPLIGAALGYPELTWTTSPLWPWVPGSGEAWAGEQRGPEATGTWLETTVTGPLAVSFEQMSGPTQPGAFMVNGVEKMSGSGYHTEILPAGSHTLRWQFTGSAAYYLPALKLKNLTLSPAAPSLQTVLGAPGLTWTTDPVHPWFAWNAGGTWKVASPLLATGQSAWLETQVTGPGIIEWSGVFPFGSNSYESHCTLEIDGLPCGRVTGGMRVHYGSGTHRVRLTVTRGSWPQQMPQVLLSSVTDRDAVAPGIPAALGVPSMIWLEPGGTAPTFNILPTGGPTGGAAISSQSGVPGDTSSGEAVITGPCRVSVQTSGDLISILNSSDYGYWLTSFDTSWHTRSLYLPAGTHRVPFIATRLRMANLTVDTADPYALWIASAPWPRQPGQDADSDGIANLVEFALGLDPVNRDRMPVPEIALSGTDVVLTLPLAPGRTGAGILWQPEASQNLQGWEPVAGAAGVSITESAGHVIIRLPRNIVENSPRAFFRLGATVQQ